MDWGAFLVSIKLATATTLLLLPLAVFLARWLAWTEFALKGVVETLVTLPLVLPPTVIGYYLLLLFSQQGLIGGWFDSWFDASLAFSFNGLLLASILVNLPFAVQPAQRSFEAIPRDVRQSALCCGLTPWRAFREIELPLARNGVVGAALLTFTHTLGEFGVVLMVGGNIAGETRTLSIAIFDEVEAFNENAAATMSLLMLAFSIFIMSCMFLLSYRRN